MKKVQISERTITGSQDIFTNRFLHPALIWLFADTSTPSSLPHSDQYPIRQSNKDQGNGDHLCAHGIKAENLFFPPDTPSIRFPVLQNQSCESSLSSKNKIKRILDDCILTPLSLLLLFKRSLEMKQCLKHCLTLKPKFIPCLRVGSIELKAVK